MTFVKFLHPNKEKSGKNTEGGSANWATDEVRGDDIREEDGKDYLTFK